MKNCSYCERKIEENTIKCNHCNTWQNEKVLDNNFKDSNKGSFKDFNVNFGIGELDFPIQVGYLKLFKHKLIYGDVDLIHDDIKKIVFKLEVISRNFITERRMLFMAETKFNGEPANPMFASSYHSNSFIKDFTRETVEKLVCINKYLSAYTFEKRLNLYLAELNYSGYFSYYNHLFFKDGSIKKNNIIVANIHEANRLGRLGFGTAFSNFRNTNQSINPYEFVIKGSGSMVKIFGFEFGTELKIDACIDSDIFFTLIEFLIKKNRYPQNTKEI